MNEETPKPDEVTARRQQYAEELGMALFNGENVALAHQADGGERDIINRAIVFVRTLRVVGKPHYGAPDKDYWEGERGKAIDKLEKMKLAYPE